MKAKSLSVKTALVITLLVTCLSVAVWGYGRVYKVAKPVAHTAAPVPKTEPDIVYDPALLNKLDNLGKLYYKLKTDCTIEGVMSATDGADSTVNVGNIDFTYCIKGSGLYYRAGKTESINADGFFLSINHKTKQITLGPQKKIESSSPVQLIGAMVTQLKSEHYALKGSTKGSQQSLTLSNEHHITCKEYTITYDTTSMMIRHLYARYTNFYAPADKSKERIMDVTLTRWDGIANPDSYLKPADVVRKEGSTWKLRQKYQDYELIIM